MCDISRIRVIEGKICPASLSSFVREEAKATLVEYTIPWLIYFAPHKVAPKPKPGKINILFTCEGVWIFPLCCLLFCKKKKREKVKEKKEVYEKKT